MKNILMSQSKCFSQKYDKFFWCTPYQAHELPPKDALFFRTLSNTVHNFQLIHGLIKREMLQRIWKNTNLRIFVCLDDFEEAGR